MTEVHAPQGAASEAEPAGAVACCGAVPRAVPAGAVPAEAVPAGATAADEGATTTFAEDGPGSPTAADGKVASPQTGWGWFRWVWRQLTSMRTALVLLFLLAVGSIPGSLLPQQGQDPAGVENYFTSHPALAPWLNHLGLFNVFAAPWFAAIYLLLFASLVGCVVPRTFRLAGAARTPPPRAPRNLARLPHSASYTVALPPQEAIAVAVAALGGKRFRLRTEEGTGGDRGHDGDKKYWVSAEKGYLREAGNLLFHLALLGVLASIAIGGLFGYKADKLMVEGDSFSETISALDEFHPGRLVSGSDLAPFTLTLKSFSASYYTSGESRGQPSSFDARGSYSSTPGAPAKPFDLRINQPLNVDSLKVYLIGHGYAPAVHGHRRVGQGGLRRGDAVHPGEHGHLLVRRRGEGPRRVADAAWLHRGLRADRGVGERHLAVRFPVG